MQVLVTGGAGFVGSHLVRALCQHANITRIVVFDNMLRGRLSRLEDVASNPRLEIIQGDIREVQQVSQVIQGIKVVFHLAAQSSVMGSIRDSEYCFSTNVQGTYRLLNAAIQAGVKRFVFTSSREVYGEPRELPVAENSPLFPKNEYGASKIAGETYCNLYRDKMEIAVLRLSNVYGADDEGRVIPNFIRRALQSDPIELYGGEQVIDFVWVQTVVEALIRAGFALSNPDGPINVASGTGTSLRDLAYRVKDLINSDSPINIVPAFSAEVVRFVGDTTRMRSILGVQPDADPLAHLSEVIRRFQIMLKEQS